MNAQPAPHRQSINTTCPICLTGELVFSPSDTACRSCGDTLVAEGSCWFDGRGIVQVQSAFLDRRGFPYVVVQARHGNHRLVSQSLMLREWQLRPDHVDNVRPAPAVAG